MLRYRLGPKYHHPIELGDAQRAIRMLRSHAGEWHLDSARIGIMGFSAGGHLAMSASTHFDAGKRDALTPSSRVELAGYRHPWLPGVSLTEAWTHAGRALLGDRPDPSLPPVSRVRSR